MKVNIFINDFGEKIPLNLSIFFMYPYVWPWHVTLKLSNIKWTSHITAWNLMVFRTNIKEFLLKPWLFFWLNNYLYYTGFFQVSKFEAGKCTNHVLENAQFLKVCKIKWFENILNVFPSYSKGGPEEFKVRGGGGRGGSSGHQTPDTIYTNICKRDQKYIVLSSKYIHEAQCEILILYHMNTNISSFHIETLINLGLFQVRHTTHLFEKFITRLDMNMPQSNNWWSIKQGLDPFHLLSYLKQ